jgi:protein O-GlcNAc transferase
VKGRTKPTASGAEIEQHRRAIRANPRNAQAHALLGLSLLRLGQLKEGIASQRRALALDPGLTALHGTLAPALHALGEHEAAADSYRRALMVEEQDADLHKGLSDVLHDLRQFEAAAASTRRAVALRPDSAEMHFGLAAAQFGMADYSGAADSFRNVLAIVPDHVDARFDLGNMLMRLKRHDEAAACLHRVIELRPDHVKAHLYLATCQRELKQFDAAVASCERALEIMPDHFMALHELGLAQHQAGKVDAALATMERALELNPGDATVLASMTRIAFSHGRVEQALKYARASVEANPDSAAAFSAMVFILSHWTMDPAELTAEHFKFGERWEAAHRAHPVPHTNDRDPGRRLQIGFVSADLYHHAVVRFIEPIFAVLQHSTQLALHVYYNNGIEDELTQRLRGYIEQWHPVADLDDDALERQIRADGIDILIDLSGHSAGNRLPVFARKPAPVQASWIGYAGTTGLQAMDYYLSDQFHLPEGRYDDQFIEKIVRMPLGAPFMPELAAPPVNPLPALTNGYLTFGSFHRPSKLNRNVIALWAKALHAAPHSRMLLGGLLEGDETALVDWFEAEGIDRGRLLLRKRASILDYLAQHHEVDVCLSPFPYTGSTTIGYALWMGVPTLTTVGPTNPSHASVCFMAHLGMSSFLADDEPSFTQLARFLSQNVSTLGALRAGMRKRFTDSVVGYPDVAAGGAEHAFRVMWQRWCAGLPAAPFRVRMADLLAAQEGAA